MIIVALLRSSSFGVVQCKSRGEITIRLINLVYIASHFDTNIRIKLLQSGLNHRIEAFIPCIASLPNRIRGRSRSGEGGIATTV